MKSVLCVACFVAAFPPPDSQDIDKKFPLDPQLRVLAEDVASPRYRELVTKKMLATDLAAEWQRVETADNPESFLKKHGGKEKVFADPDLKRAYERRVEIRSRFLDLMREGYKTHKQTPPFDRGEQAEVAGTRIQGGATKGALLATVLPAAGAEQHWPRFRGPTGQGITGAKGLPTTWDKNGTNIVWRRAVPGLGNSSPIVWGERIFVTSATEDGGTRSVHCFRRSDGKLLWTREVSKKPEPGVRPKNGYASATPVTDGERVVAFLGSCGLVCYDMEGKLLWQYDALDFRTTHGTGSSPLLYGNSVIFVHDQNQAESVFLALDKRTGSLLWKHPRAKSMGWSTPVIVRVGDHDELVFAGGATVKGYDPVSGKELWSLAGPTIEVVPTIVVGKDVIYSASGRNGPTLALRPGGEGDVTKSHLVWRAVRGGPHVPSPILVGNRLYTINDTGLAQCLDAATGKLIWHERLEDLFSASPIEAGGLLYFPSESGVTYVIRAGDQFEVVASNDLGSPILASPAVIGNQLILRTQKELVCLCQRNN